jgi:tRNA pseudouridine32 synthase/23S rRNA pseudouridine746 synthase
VRDGLGPARVRLRGGPVLAELSARFGAPARAKVLAGEVVGADGAVIDAKTVLPAGASVYLYRELPDEVPVPFEIPVLYRDDDIVVVDKPHFVATMPRGRHVAQSALVRLRRELELPELSPAHRLDRLTAGVLVFTARREMRGGERGRPLPADPAHRAYPPAARAHGLAGDTDRRGSVVPQRD